MPSPRLCPRNDFYAATLSVAANIRFSMHSGGKAAHAQFSRIFRSAKLAGKRSGESAVVHQGPAELWVCVFARQKAAICQLVVNS